MGDRLVGDESVSVVTGVRAGERWLCAALLRQAQAEPEALERPLRLVVPSRSLRVHLASQLVAANGRPLLGVQLHTLDGLARAIVERAGVPRPDPALFPILVRRAARSEPALAEGLDGLADGYGAVVGALDDLLDAGFEAVHADVLEEHLAEQPAAPGAIRRARAIVRVAARVLAELAAHGVGHRSRELLAARDCLERDPELLPARGWWLYGFADATGVQADLIATVLRLAGARLVLEAPGAGAHFGRTFRERLGVALPSAPAHEDPDVAPPRVTLLRAPSRAAEVRAVAERLRTLLDADVPAERIAVVARDLAPYRVVLRGQLGRLAVPFSGISEVGAATALRRQLNDLLSLLEQGADAAMEPWLALRGELAEPLRADLRHAFHRRGALRLDEVARFAGWAPERRLELDARRGLLPADADRPARVARRVVDGAALAASGQQAGALLARLSARPGRAALAAHAEWLRELVADLAWTVDGAASLALDAALAELPGEPEVDPEEFLSLLRRVLSLVGMSPLGGEGGGVQVLSVMEARSRSFDRLFVLGMNRGVFPRTIRDDALLPDAVRARLREVLPGLPVKREGYDEERFLFAQLLSAAPEVTLSFSETNDAGRPQPRSPLLDSLERDLPGIVHEQAASLHAPRDTGAALAARERALLAGLHGDRAAFTRAFREAAAEDALLANASPGADALAAARLAVLAEIDAPPARRQLLGPYFGFVGEVSDPADPRRAPLFVTRLEDVARCPWNAFLSRVLRLAPPPDAAHDLPSANDARLLGNVVHGVLERIAQPAAGEAPTSASPAELCRREPVSARWPDDATLERLALERAASELRDEANAVPGYARVLAQRALPFLERARECDWLAEPPAVVGCEVQATAQVRDASGEPREIAFKADRVDRRGDGLLFTDYKTGKAIASQRREAARQEQLLRQIAAGRSLQAMLYARAGGEGTQGRYLFLGERVPDEARSLVARDVDPAAAALDAALRVLLDAWDRGSFLPRLRQADRDEEPGTCRYCDVKDACLRGDSGARLRLEHWSENEAPARGDAERAAAAAYTIGTTSEGETP